MPGACPQGLRTHQALDLVQAAGDALRQDIAPDATSAIGSVAGLEARIDLGANQFVIPRALARRAGQPGMESRARDIQRFAKPCHRPDRAVPRDESEPHIASLAK